MDYNAATQNVRDFLSSYFHQDWALDWGNVDGFIDAFSREGWSREDLQALADSLRAVKNNVQSLQKSETDELLYQEFGCYYVGDGGGLALIVKLIDAISDLTNKAQPLAKEGRLQRWTYSGLGY